MITKRISELPNVRLKHNHVDGYEDQDGSDQNGHLMKVRTDFYILDSFDISDILVVFDIFDISNPPLLIERK